MPKKAQRSPLKPELIQELLAHMGDQELFGRDGFFQTLKQNLVNGILEGEMNHHVGYSKHDKQDKSLVKPPANLLSTILPISWRSVPKVQSIPSLL